MRNEQIIHEYRRRFAAGPIGAWCSLDDDGSHMAYGARIEFAPGGTGVETYWSAGNQEERKFTWKPVGDRRIVLQAAGEPERRELAYDFHVRDSVYGHQCVCIRELDHWGSSASVADGFMGYADPLVHEDGCASQKEAPTTPCT